MKLSVWRETSKKLTVYRVCYTPIETLVYVHEGKARSPHPCTIPRHFRKVKTAFCMFYSSCRDHLKAPFKGLQSH